MPNKVMVISAHCDDESFGALGTLLKHKEAGDEVSFLWFSSARGTLVGALAVFELFYGHYAFTGLVDDQQFDKYPLVQFITPIEYYLNKWKPNIVYCPYIYDLNKDHRIVSEAVMVGCRPYKEQAPKEVWMYAIPGSTELGFQTFKRDKSVKIDKKLKEKLIREWYPNEMINGREVVTEWEYFQRWPDNGQIK